MPPTPHGKMKPNVPNTSSPTSSASSVATSNAPSTPSSAPSKRKKTASFLKWPPAPARHSSPPQLSNFSSAPPTPPVSSSSLTALNSRNKPAKTSSPTS